MMMRDEPNTRLDHDPPEGHHFALSPRSSEKVGRVHRDVEADLDPREEGITDRQTAEEIKIVTGITIAGEETPEATVRTIQGGTTSHQEVIVKGTINAVVTVIIGTKGEIE